MRAHGGAIRIDSKHDAGTVAEVLFPATSPARNQREDRPSRRRLAAVFSPPLSGRALLVDDEVGIRRFCGQVLRDVGLEVVAAGSGEEALVLFEKYGRDFALVVMDESMPGKSGKVIMQQMRALDPSVRLVHMSGYPPDTDATEKSSARAVFLAKPFTTEGLVQAVRAALVEPA